MDEAQVIKVLLVEDDEDDFVITRDLLSEIPGKKFALDWAKNFEDGLELMLRNQHEVCLLDYRLGAHNGVELLRIASDRGCQASIILLTTLGQHKLDVEAMEAGASDYLVKGRLDRDGLERSIRYALQRKRARALAAFEQARLAAFGAQVGLVLTRRDSLDGILAHCAQAMVQFLNASLAQISIFVSREKSFVVRANAGPIYERNPVVQQLPRIELDPRQAAEGKPIIIRQLLGEERMPNPEWIKREGLASYAAYPLVLEDKLIGLMSIFTSQPVSDQIGQEMGSVANGIALCIERKRSEEALRVSENKYRSVVESINEVIFQLDANSRWTFLNPAWTVITGFPIQESLGTSFLEHSHPEDREHNRQLFAHLIEGKLEYFRHETRYLTRDGNVCWLKFNARVLRNKQGTPAGMSGSIIDITERRLAEVQIEKLAAFPRVNPNPILEFSENGALTYANDAAHQMAKTLGRQDLLAILPQDAVDIVGRCLSSGQKHLRQQVVIGDRTLSWSFYPVMSSRVVHCYGGDVTEMLSLEAQFRQSQKMECVGQLAAGVAHDINNMLTVVHGRANLLIKTASLGSDCEKSLRQISAAAERAARFIRQLLMFSRKQVIQTKALGLNGVIHNLETMLPRMLGEDIVLETDFAPDLPRVEADTGMLEQVIMNLAVNARDAMPKGGKLIIATSFVTLDETTARQHAGARPGSFVCLTVKDSGCGMDRATLERIFEPFFTTKEVGKGTGLGLATVYGIVKQHRGWVEVESERGKGSTFKIFFPAVAAGSHSPPEPTDAPGDIRGGTESILVVEDEMGLRELVYEVLRHYHYEVAVAGSGAEALRVWDEYEGKFDLLLTDMIMPGGMTGRDLADELKKRKPQLNVIYSSGYSPELIGNAQPHNEMTFLAKPYLPIQLARTIRESLDRPKPGEKNSLEGMNCVLAGTR